MANDTPEPVLRAYRYALDPTQAQLGDLARHAGATRWAANRAIAWMSQAQLAWEQRRDQAITALAGPAPEPPDDLDEKAAAHWAAQVRGERIKAWDKQARPILKAQAGELAAETKRADARRKTLMEAAKRLGGQCDTWRAAARALDARRRTLAADAQDTSRPGLPQVEGHLAAVTADLARAKERLAQARGDLAEAKGDLAVVRVELLRLKKIRFERGDAIPSAMDCAAMWRETRDLDAKDGGSPWHAEVNAYCFTGGFERAQSAVRNWMASRTGARAGRAMGRPRFKKKGRATDSFTLFHDVRNPTIRPDGYKRLQVPRIGSIRLQRNETAKPLARLIAAGHATVKSVTISRGGSRWYASVLCELTPEAMRRRELRSRAHQKVTRAQQARRPEVGVEWGVRKLVVLSDETVFDNPRHGKRHARALAKANQAVSRKPRRPGQPASANWAKAVRRLGRVHHRTAEARRGALNQVSARVAINYPAIAVRDLAVKQMTRSAKGTVAAPGREVKVKARFNRAVLDTAPAELRRQLQYKAAQWGAGFRVAPGDLPSSQTCSRCGWRDPSIPLSQVVFRCGNVVCGAKIDREVNAARNILHHAVPVASDIGETLNACGDGVSPSGDRGRLSVKQEGRPRRRGGSFRGSDPPASPGS